MKSKLLVVVLGVAVLAALVRVPSAADQPQKVANGRDQKAATPESDWKDDPVCQMVFFAVLEGLYLDGASDEVVECIVPKTPSTAPDPLQKNFVPQCPICHPVYEAFALYQKRPNFKDDNKRNAFGKTEISPEIIAALKHEDLRTRVVNGIRPLVEKYVTARLSKMNLTAEERQEWNKKLIDRVGQGTAKYSELRSTEAGRKLGWGFYGGCGACTGTEAACKAILAKQSQK